MQNKRWSTSKSTVYNLSYHLIWCTKFRRKVLTDEIQEELKKIIKAKAEEEKWDIVALETMQDHVHLFLKAKPCDSVSYIMAQIKGRTSHELRKKFPELWHRLPSLWTRSYYADSAGVVSGDRIKEYIKNQKNK